MTQPAKTCLLPLLVLSALLTPSGARPGEWRTYRNTAFGYALTYPSGWQVIEARPRREDAAARDADVLAPPELQKATFLEIGADMVPGEFVVQVLEYSGGPDLDAWADAEFTDVAEESLVIETRNATLAGRPARAFDVFGFDHTETVVAQLRGQRLYLLSFSGADPNDPRFDRHREIYERMRRSFELDPAD